MTRLKVFRTPIGFHDAYVAAPSRKAALAAWGAEKDLFARGAAEEVTDPALTEAPLTRAGEVIKVSRGGRDEQLAALPADRPKAATKRKVADQAKPKPSRADLVAAETALAAAEARHEAVQAALAEEEAALDRRKREAARERPGELDRLERTRDEAEKAYRTALEQWRT